MNWPIIELWLFLGGLMNLIFFLLAAKKKWNYIRRSVSELQTCKLDFCWIPPSKLHQHKASEGIKAWHSPTAPLHEKQLVGLNWKQLLLSDGVTSWYTVAGSNLFGRYGRYQIAVLHGWLDDITWYYTSRYTHMEHLRERPLTLNHPDQLLWLACLGGEKCCESKEDSRGIRVDASAINHLGMDI